MALTLKSPKRIISKPKRVVILEENAGKIEGKWWPDRESNTGHADFQSTALPTELSGRKRRVF
jgi:hypothetical protein